MKAQEILDKVSKHLIKQNAISQDYYGSCLYRGDNDRKCAVGCLIKDKYYSKSLEDQASSDKDVQKALKLSVGSLSKKSLALIEALQNLHDMYDPDTWWSGLANLADEYGLKNPHRKKK